MAKAHSRLCSLIDHYLRSYTKLKFYSTAGKWVCFCNQRNGERTFNCSLNWTWRVSVGGGRIIHESHAANHHCLTNVIVFLKTTKFSYLFKQDIQITNRFNEISKKPTFKALEPAWITSRQIEAGQRAMTRNARRGGKIWTYLNVANNSGARELMCIRIIGASNRRYAHIGDVIVAVIKEAVPNMPLERSEVVRAVIVRTCKEFIDDLP
ncbi:hypothetical protein KY290_000919 [Solanum tuberosum]|uniref:50S ribosomal protein L14, chloroplastic n=1 Tax=Solanum tuberosum TaxID=4113 RepID=A0ABQ7WM20_SOLTU|nr:hypothetical protein KY290_000919 [Solanum tuberosum]